ncbi:MAG: hypothetical protein LUD74_02425, partial [Tannerellaceae bacterium]|nr:hypothetical protein [Tannerellaceae bacterium]
MNRSPTLANIRYTKAVKIYLEKLVNTLYIRNYFGFKEVAKQYVQSIIKEMQETIHLKPKRRTSRHFERYGRNLYYVFYPKNKRTTWYFFFTYHFNGNIY